MKLGGKQDKNKRIRSAVMENVLCVLSTVSAKRAGTVTTHYGTQQFWTATIQLSQNQIQFDNKSMSAFLYVSL